MRKACSKSSKDWLSAVHASGATYTLLPDMFTHLDPLLYGIAKHLADHGANSVSIAFIRNSHTCLISALVSAKPDLSKFLPAEIRFHDIETTIRPYYVSVSFLYY